MKDPSLLVEDDVGIHDYPIIFLIVWLIHVHFTSLSPSLPCWCVPLQNHGVGVKKLELQTHDNHSIKRLVSD